MPLGKGYSVEEQLTGQAKVGGIQFDLFDRRYPVFDFFSSSTRLDAPKGTPVHDVHRTPATLNLQGPLIMRPRCGLFAISI
mgnify:CR=1 FL=1